MKSLTERKNDNEISQENKEQDIKNYDNYFQIKR